MTRRNNFHISHEFFYHNALCSSYCTACMNKEDECDILQMHHTVSEYFRTTRPRLDAMKFICRMSLDVKNF